MFNLLIDSYFSITRNKYVGTHNFLLFMFEKYMSTEHSMVNGYLSNECRGFVNQLLSDLVHYVAKRSRLGKLVKS